MINKKILKSNTSSYITRIFLFINIIVMKDIFLITKDKRLKNYSF